jgi:PKD repeat protein
VKRLAGALLAAVLLIPTGPARGQASWFDNHWRFRRAIDIIPDEARPSEDRLALVECFTAGHLNADGGDLHVTAEDGTPAKSHLLMTGPGDRVRFVIQLAGGAKRYYAYFGNPDAAPLAASAKDFSDFAWHCGLLMDMRTSSGGAANNFREIENAWAQSGPFIGATLIDQPFIGVNPFGEQQRIIIRFTGRLNVPVDGSYEFAGSATERGALYLDGKSVLYIPNGAGDARNNTTLNITHGPHDLVIYEDCFNGTPRLSIAWKQPSIDRIDVIGAPSLGVVAHGKPGPLEEIRKAFTADFACDYLGECFFDNVYSHRYQFTARPPAGATVQWDFGDGQTASGVAVDHVYLDPGIYPVQATYRLGQNSDTQTTRLSVSRDFAHLDNPRQDTIVLQSRAAAGYNLSALPARELASAVLLHLAAGRKDAAIAAAQALAAQRTQPDPVQAFNALDELSTDLLKSNQLEATRSIWHACPPESALYPRAARYEAQLCLWWLGDAASAVKLLTPVADNPDATLKRVYGQALVLDGQAAAGEKFLSALPGGWDRGQRVARSGAAARTIEFYINSGDWETGEETWETWSFNDPASFMSGYSVLLRSRLMELRRAARPAAAICADFAQAVPNSAYAPQLLDRASKLVAITDPAKSVALRQLLKQRYPEDPLSQQ